MFNRACQHQSEAVHTGRQRNATELKSPETRSCLNYLWHAENAHRPAKKNKNAKNVGTMRPNNNNSQNNITQNSCDNDAFDSLCR